MATIETDDESTVRFVDLSPYVRAFTVDNATIDGMHDLGDRLHHAIAGLRNAKLTVRGFFDPSPALHRALWRRSHPRIRRMHSAYRRRHGRGRW